MSVSNEWQYFFFFLKQEKLNLSGAKLHRNPKFETAWLQFWPLKDSSWAEWVSVCTTEPTGLWAIGLGDDRLTEQKCRRRSAAAFEGADDSQVRSITAAWPSLLEAHYGPIDSNPTYQAPRSITLLAVYTAWYKLSNTPVTAPSLSTLTLSVQLSLLYFIFFLLSGIFAYLSPWRYLLLSV